MDRLTEMEAFATVVDQGGFTDAARKMGLSKSAVSKHVSSLENRLGVRLLNRTTRRVSPTEIGLLYYDRARRVLTDAVEADALVAAHLAPPSGVLRIAVCADFASAHLARLLPGFLRRHPDVTVEMELAHSPVDRPAEGIDLVVGPHEPGAPGLESRAIAESHWRMIASPAYFEEYGRPERIDDLSKHRLLHRAADSRAAVWILRAPSGEERRIRTGGALMANNALAVLQACKDGLGIAYLPGYLCDGALARGEVEIALPALPEQPVAVSTTYRQDCATKPNIKGFVDYLAECFAAETPAAG